VITPNGTLQIDPWTLRLTTVSQVTAVGAVVCNATPAVIPGTVVLSPFCFTFWAQYGYVPAWAIGCR
jgi:hypothetical protein